MGNFLTLFLFYFSSLIFFWNFLIFLTIFLNISMKIYFPSHFFTLYPSYYISVAIPNCVYECLRMADVWKDIRPDYISKSLQYHTHKHAVEAKKVCDEQKLKVYRMKVMRNFPHKSTSHTHRIVMGAKLYLYNIYRHLWTLLCCEGVIKLNLR